MIRWFSRVFLILAIPLLMASNVLSLTSSAFHGMLSAALSTAIGVKTVHQGAQRQLLAQRDAVKRSGRRIAERTQRMAVRGASSLPLRSLPLIGSAAAVAWGAAEWIAQCENARDIQRLYEEMEIEDDTELGQLIRWCSPFTSGDATPLH